MKYFYNSLLTTSVLFLCLIVSSVGIAQEEFSFQLYFQDDNGNKDTLTLGFDPLATDSIDASFGEINLMNQAWDTVFEVRAGQMDFSTSVLSPKTMSKKAIAKKHTFGASIYIAVNNQASGIQMSWDNAVFNDSLVKGAKFYFLECSTPSNNNIVLLKDVNGAYNLNNSLFDCSPNDSVNYFRIQFTSKVEYVSISDEANKIVNALIYPNPVAQDFITLETPNEIDFSKTIFLKVLDLMGREVESQRIKKNQEIISTQNWKRGIYTGIIIQEGKIIYTEKLIRL